MGTNMKDLKEWLKTSTTEIRIRKSMHKQYQREGYEKYEWVYESCYGGHRQNTKKDSRKYFDNMNALWRLRREYRHRHIAYSELRGKTRAQIEASYPYEGQPESLKPDEKRIQKIKDEVIKSRMEQQEVEISASSQMAEGSGF